MNKSGNRFRIGFCALFIGLFFIAIAGTPLRAASPGYPNRPITLIIPFPAGATTDLGGRALAESMEKYLKQPVVVVNRVGGATTVGGYALSNAKPDGYTLGFFPPFAAIPEAYTYFQEAPYTSKDIKPISAIAAPLISVVVKGDAPWNSFKDLIGFAKKNPGLKVGTAGKQTAQHMLLTTLNKMEKTGFVGVPFSGDATNLPALLGGHISAGVMDYSVLSSLVDSKTIKILAVVTDKRAEFAAAVPTVVELGYPVVYVPLLGLVGPKGLPDEISEKLSGLVATISGDKEFQTRMRNIPLQMRYENAGSYQNSLSKYKENILSFFKEEGLVK